MPRKLTQDEFIERCKLLYGDKYDYSKVEYVNNNTKVCVICPIHGEFMTRPADFLRGFSCASCGNCKRLTKEEFINRAREIWGDKYDYSNVEYKNNKTKVCIICPEHGEFWQRPNDHLSGYGCIKCVKKYNYTTEEWVELACKSHDNKYWYDKVMYKNAYTKVCITCPEHGDFWQTPANHINGMCGCPVCNSNIKSKMENNIGILLDKNNIKYERQKTFDWLKYKRKMPLDFFLPDYKIAIEVQGEQHFTPIEKFGGNQEFNIRKIRDEIKFKLCEENGVKMFYITKRNNNIDEILEYINGTSNKEK